MVVINLSRAVYNTDYQFLPIALLSRVTTGIMKRLKTDSVIAKLGESAYNALVMTNQVSGLETRILHYSYNLSAEDGAQCSFNEDSYGSLTRTSQSLGSQRMTRRAFSKDEKETNRDFDKEKLRRNSIGHLPGNKNAVNGSANQKEGQPLIYFGGAMQAGLVHEESTADLTKDTDDRVTQNNGSRGNHPRKYGLGERTNVSIMSHKLRKKAVCDSTDNSHYQRQFLRVLNKRF